MKTIWKYTLEPLCDIDMPIGAKILDVQTQDNEPQLWALVDTDADKEMRSFATYGTGHEVPDNISNHIGSFQLDDGRLVFHVFEE